MAETGFELRIARAGELHYGVPDHPWNDAAYGGEGEEEGLRIPCPVHEPPPRRALLPQ